MNKLFTHSLLAMAIATSAPLSLRAEEDTKTTDYSVAQYSTHMITGFLSYVSAIALPVTGMIPGAVLWMYKHQNIPAEFVENITQTTISEHMHETLNAQHINLNDPAVLKFMYPALVTLVIGSMVGTALGMYTVYKTPQWTDTYLLGKKTIRSKTQNIVTFLSRMGSLIAPYLWAPFLGIALGEFLNNRISSEEEAAEMHHLE